MRSSVRKQRVPHAATQDSGIRAIYGRLAFSEAAKLVTDQSAWRYLYGRTGCEKTLSRSQSGGVSYTS
jgi:hypothetical protein